MCGIAGIVNKTGQLVDGAVLQKMTDRVSHRGPDGSGFQICGKVGLGHRRLAIIDLRQAASQPMHSWDGTYSIVFNGEIYNYIEVREDLTKIGHRFRTESDTEVLLEAYAEWGPACLDRFNGMWAFAIQDRLRNLLFCSRDRFGVKPFYYIDSNILFAFGSEIKQLLDFLPSRTANAEILSTFLMTGMTEYSEHTFFNGVRRLVGGHNLTFDLRTNIARIERYYRPKATDLRGTTEWELEERFFSTMSRSVELRLRSDVPVGACLSGGCDSSTIAAIAAPRYRERSGNPLSAITAVSSQSDNDESLYARKVVEHSGLRWITVLPTQHDVADSIAKIAYHQDEPFPSASIVMQYLVMRTAREHGITVLLDGQGADETLLGYTTHFGMHVVASLLNAGIGAALSAFSAAMRQNPSMTLSTTLKFSAGLSSSRCRYLLYRWRQRHLRSIPHIPAVLREVHESIPDLQRFQEVEIGTATLPPLLRYEDRNSMAFGVETRLPFVDYKQVELCLGIPLEFKLRNGWTKWILRRSMDRVLPPSIAWRKDKIGFAAPQKQWDQQHKDIMLAAVLNCELLNKLTIPSRVRVSFPWMHSTSRWRLFSTALWCSQFGVGTAH